MNKELQEAELIKYIMRLAKDPHLNPLDQIRYSERIADMRKLLAFKKHQ